VAWPRVGDAPQLPSSLHDDGDDDDDDYHYYYLPSGYLT
jgi:hypothetical protein